MGTVLVLLAASTLLGLATGLMFRVWVNMWVAPLIAVVCAMILRSHDFAFAQGVFIIVGCLFASQIAYLIGSFFGPGAGIAPLLLDDTLDDQPNDAREYEIRGEQEKRNENPPRPPSSEA